MSTRGRPTTESDALLVRSVDYGEADRILTFLTERDGKVSLLARGARRSRRRFSGALESCALLRVRYALGAGELGTLGEAELTEAFPRLLGALDAIQTAAAGLELLREASPAREADPRLFAHAVEFLRAVDGGAHPLHTLRLCFEVRALALVGFAPRFDACVRTGKRVLEGQAAAFDPALGGVVSQAAGGGPILLPGRLRAALEEAAGGAWLPRGDWPPEDVRLADRALTAFLDERLGRPLPARAMLREARPEVRVEAARTQEVVP